MGKDIYDQIIIYLFARKKADNLLKKNSRDDVSGLTFKKGNSFKKKNKNWEFRNVVIAQNTSLLTKVLKAFSAWSVKIILTSLKIL